MSYFISETIKIIVIVMVCCNHMCLSCIDSEILNIVLEMG